MNAENDALFQWLTSRDAGLPGLAERSSGRSVEAFLGNLLWESTTSFVKGPLRELKCGGSPATEFIQYFSYPLHSHFKEHKEKGKSWIDRYPLFFQGGKSLNASLEVVARYATLYGGLQQLKTRFSFSGFANNQSLKPIPRHIVLDLAEVKARRSPLVTLRLKTSDVVVLTAHLSPTAEITLSHLESIKRQFKTSKPFPLLDRPFDPAMADDFWKWFAELTESQQCKDSINQVDQLAETIVPVMAGNLTRDLIKELGLSIEEANKVGIDLATFTAWNFLLRFRRVVYIPYRTLEPQGDNIATIRSWSGVILCLKDKVALPEEVIPFLSASRSKHSSTGSRTTRISPLLAAMKLLVDVATSHASIGDWKCYQNDYVKSVLRREHAAAISQGFEHEVRNLQLLAGLAIKINDKALTEEVLAELDGNLAFSQLVFDAYTRTDQIISKRMLFWKLDTLLEIWKDHLQIEIPDADRNDLQDVPYPLLFVLAELCRNAYCHSLGRKMTIVQLSLKGGGSAMLEATVRNETLNGNIERQGKRQEIHTFGGLDLVADIVEDVLGGKFGFIIKDGKATATVRIESRN